MKITGLAPLILIEMDLYQIYIYISYMDYTHSGAVKGLESSCPLCLCVVVRCAEAVDIMGGQFGSFWKMILGVDCHRSTHLCEFCRLLGVCVCA